MQRKNEHAIPMTMNQEEREGKPEHESNVMNCDFCSVLLKQTSWFGSNGNDSLIYTQLMQRLLYI